MSRKSKSPAVELDPTSESTAEEGAISNAQAVRNALAEGLESIDDIDSFVRTEYGKDIPRQQISAYKSQSKRKAGEPTARRGRPPRAAIEGYLAPPSRRGSNDRGDLLDVLQTLKPLVADMGPDRVKKLVDLLS